MSMYMVGQSEVYLLNVIVYDVLINRRLGIPFALKASYLIVLVSMLFIYYTINAVIFDEIRSNI